MNELNESDVDLLQQLAILNINKTKAPPDLGKYIKTEIIKINDKTYLIDEYDIVYEYNENNTIIGRKTNDGYKMFVDFPMGL